jgi:hypothetical protein
MKDSEQTCRSCGRGFQITDGERSFYRTKRLNLPTRCGKCRGQRKDRVRAVDQPYYDRQMIAPG